MEIEHLPSIYVAYRWSDTARWEFLRDTVRSVLTTVEARLHTAGAPGLKGRISGPNRLRGGAGRSILESIEARLDANTILIADLSHDERGAANANVLLETGIARARGARIFLVAEETTSAGIRELLPGDLQGWYLSLYARRERGYSFGKEGASLRMQLLGAVLDLLRQPGVDPTEEDFIASRLEESTAEEPETKERA
jgi:hypothetical protein